MFTAITWRNPFFGAVKHLKGRLAPVVHSVTYEKQKQIASTMDEKKLFHLRITKKILNVPLASHAWCNWCETLKSCICSHTLPAHATDVTHSCVTWLIHMRHDSASTEWRRSIGCLKLRSFSTQVPLIVGLFCGKWPIKMRHSMGLRHLVFLFYRAN